VDLLRELDITNKILLHGYQSPTSHLYIGLSVTNLNGTMKEFGSSLHCGFIGDDLHMNFSIDIYTLLAYSINIVKLGNVTQYQQYVSNF
jgi:hypothetical protein